MNMDDEKSRTIRMIDHRSHDQVEDIGCSDDGEDLYPPSPLSSSPPRDFNIHPEGRYIPILDNDDDYHNEDETSLALSLSIGSCAPQPIAASIATIAAAATNSSRVIRCPVCEKPMRTFYCAKCIQTGRFVTLEHNQRNDVTFDITSNISVKKNFIATHQFGHNSLPFMSEEQILEEKFQIRLRALTRKSEALRVLYKNHQIKLSETKNSLKQTKQEVEKGKKANKVQEGKIDLMKRYIASRKASVKKRWNAVANLREELKQHVTRRVYQLTQDIFPIEELNLHEQNSSFINMETSPLLTFSDGSHHQIEQSTAYSIVEPWLPSNGDYNAYSLWVNDNKDQLQAPMEGTPDRNPAFRIGAALGYTTQLVKNLATYMDVILPARLDFDIFNRELLDDDQFSYNVAKLNTNVIHLCVTQGLDISLLSSHRTLKNLLVLFNLNICDLGRRPILELTDEEDDKVATRIESQLAKDLSLIHDEYYDFSKHASNYDDDGNDDVLESEWEISENIIPIDSQIAEQSIQQDSYISRPLRLLSSFWTASGN